MVNVYDRNEINWFNLFVDPIEARTGHSGNPAVLKRIFKPPGKAATAPGAAPLPRS